MNSELEKENILSPVLEYYKELRGKQELMECVVCGTKISKYWHADTDPLKGLYVDKCGPCFVEDGRKLRTRQGGE